MNIRVMGTAEECAAATAYYRGLENDPNVKYVEVSKPYTNRGSSSRYRVYIEVQYYDERVTTESSSKIRSVRGH